MPCFFQAPRQQLNITRAQTLLSSYLILLMSDYEIALHCLLKNLHWYSLLLNNWGLYHSCLFFLILSPVYRLMILLVVFWCQSESAECIDTSEAQIISWNAAKHCFDWRTGKGSLAFIYCLKRAWMRESIPRAVLRRSTWMNIPFFHSFSPQIRGEPFCPTVKALVKTVPNPSGSYTDACTSTSALENGKVTDDSSHH